MYHDNYPPLPVFFCLSKLDSGTYYATKLERRFDLLVMNPNRVIERGGVSRRKSCICMYYVKFATSY